MITRMLGLDPVVNEPWSGFANRLRANIQALGQISIVAFDVSRRASSRAGAGFAATIMYRRTTPPAGTAYLVFDAEGTPEQAEADLNTQMVADRFQRARFLRALYTGNERTLNIGLIAIVDGQAAEPAERYSQSAAFILAPGQTIPAGGSATVSVVNKDMVAVRTIVVHNPTPNAVVTAQAPGLAFKDAQTGLWYHYPSCY
jgi:hypothetical protein